MKAKKIHLMKTTKLMAKLAGFKKNPKEKQSRYYKDIKAEYNKRISGRNKVD